MYILIFKKHFLAHWRVQSTGGADLQLEQRKVNKNQTRFATFTQFFKQTAFNLGR